MTTNPDQVDLKRDEHGRLTICRDGQEIRVTARPCFPWTHPRELISFRDEDHNEVALIRHLSDLSGEASTALQAALKEASFMLEITSIRSIEKEFELRNWQVETKQGQRQFQTRLDDWPRPLQIGGSVIHDVGGDQYLLPPLEQLDATSRQLVWPLLDATDT